MSNVQVGTYNVNTDCSVTVSLFDPFPAANAGMVPVTTTPPGTATGTGTTTGTGSVTTTGVQAGKVTLQGLILNNAAEIDLVATNSSAAGATVRLVKTAQFSSCTNATLSGPYTISGTGEYLPSAGSSTLTSGTGSATTGTTTTVTTSTPTAGTLAGAFFPGVTGSQGTPFNLLGRFVADGTGNFATDSASLASPLTAGFSGTYTVNADCTGNGRLTDQNGVSRNISFVLVNTAAQCSVGAIPQSSSRQDLQFVFSDPGVFGSGKASQQ
jgi:hypothetical protein